MKLKICSLIVGSLLASSAFANTLSNPEIGIVLDGYYQDGQRNNSERGEGFGLGHTELNMSANIDDKFYGNLTTVIESHGDHTELLLEEAFVQTTAMPYGLSLRAGRFLSDFGYLNNQHLHTDSFVERPAAYRTFLGSHYYDDGVQANLILPTDMYVKFGAEALTGEKMQADGDGSDVGVFTTTFKIGDDISDSSSWQFGLSYLHNRNGMKHDFADDHHAHGDEHDHDHSHGAAVTGKNLYGADFVWKWAPDGNYKYNNFTLATEYMILDALADEQYHDAADNLHAYYVSGVYRFNPSWSAGIRYGEADSYYGHEHHHHGTTHNHGPDIGFHDTQEREVDLMIAWDSSHFGTIRAQYSRVEGIKDGRSQGTDNVFTLQYNMTFGAHGAHAF